jgi:hypothetical protein
MLDIREAWKQQRQVMTGFVMNNAGRQQLAAVARQVRRQTAPGASGANGTAANVDGASSRRQSSCRQRNNWLTWIPASPAIADATAPRSNDAPTIRRFCHRPAPSPLHRRMTSTRPFVIVTIHGISHIFDGATAVVAAIH